MGLLNDIKFYEWNKYNEIGARKYLLKLEVLKTFADL